MNPPGHFSFSRAVREWCFVQVPLLDLGEFRKEARRRGLDGFGLFDREPWETLDHEELLVPVAYARHGFWLHSQQESLEDGDLAIREEVGHRPWAQLEKEAAALNDERCTPQVLYHQWQLFWLHDLEQRLRPLVAWGNLGDGIESFYETRARAAAVPDPPPLDPLRAAADEWRVIELLLIRVQNVFFPFERGGPGHVNWRGSGIGGLTEDAAEWAMEQLGSLDYTALAEECGVDSNDLSRIYERLAETGQRIDPNGDLFDLLDQVRRSRRNKLAGDARLAVDFYDAARVLRSWHFRLTGK
jgi:hypothetical protein